MCSTPFWRKIHQTISGHSQNITEDIVTEILKLSKTELLEGLLSYRPYTKKGYHDWVAISDVSICMKEFVHDISQVLNLDTSTAYPVMCNYLMFEYYGKIKEFWQITRMGSTIHLKESIWNFYTAERMFLLKTWRHIFECVDKDYEFAEQYKDFLKTIKIEELQNNLITQFEELLNEVTSNTFDERNPYNENWLCRNIREQIEILLILILTATHKPLDTPKLSHLIKLFTQNNFGTQPAFFDIRKYAKAQDLDQLMYAEIGCYFSILENYWDIEIADFWNQDSTSELDKSLLNLHLNPGHIIIMLAWLTLKFKSLNRDEDAEKILELFKRQPFILWHKILSDSMFKDCTVGEVVLRATHKMLDELCLMFDDRKILYEDGGVIKILAEFLKQPDLAEICLQTRNGLDCMMEIAIESFPHDFYSFTTIAQSLLGLRDQYKQTMHLLNNFPSFLSEMTWTIPKEEISVLRKNQPAFPDSDLIVFPPKTVVRSYRIFGKNLIQYKGKYSYFFHLEYLVTLLINNGLCYRKFDEVLVKKIIAGYGVVIQAIRYCVDMDLRTIGLERIILKLNKLLVHLDGPLLNFELVKLYFDLQNALMLYRQSSFFKICPEIVWKIFFPKLKPEYLTQNVKNLLLNQYVFEDRIFMQLFQKEEFKEDHTLLLTYIRILSNIIKVKFQFKNFQLSGVVYLFNYVFLQHQTWVYKDENQKTQITLECLKIFHYVLQKHVEDLTDIELKIFQLCNHAFLHNVYVIDSFLRLFVKERYYLIYAMERESNWQYGPSLDSLQCIRMQLALLLLIMNRKKAIGDCCFNERLPFVVKPVASYFTNSYSPLIAELSCRFLEKLSQDPFVPLLALLELDHYQVQSLFLERLRDPLEEENVKMAIIDLINTCISSQDGMTAAFFNLKCFMYWDGAENDVINGDSVSDFMVDYLQNIKKSHEYFKNPLQLGILRLLYNLWLNHRENLIENIANLKDFWPVMVDPFFCDYKQDLEIYTIILRIINLEIGANMDKVDEKLVKTIDKFFKDKKRITNWTKFVLVSSQSHSKNKLDLLSVWMEFLVLTKKVMADSFDNDLKFVLIDCCLDGLHPPEGGFNNIETIYLWSQLYLLLITTWAVYEKKEQVVLGKLQTFLHALNTYYKYLTPKIKENILCAINRTIIDLHDYFSVNTAQLLTFLYSIGPLIDAEYYYLESEVFETEDDAEKVRRLKPWLIIIFIGNSIMALDNVDEIGLWFYYEQFLQRVMDSVGSMLENSGTLPFAKLGIDFLISYAESPFVKDFLKEDLFSFYFKLRPPPLSISVGEAILSGLPVNLKEWWFILITLIKLNRILIQQIGDAMLRTCFSFITQHDMLLKEIISLTKHTVDMSALTLVCETLKLILVVLTQMPHWRVDSPYSYEIIIDGIKTTINACVLSILGYKKINFYNIIKGKNLDLIDCTPTNLLVSVLNKLTEIVYWGCSCLKKTKTDLVTQLNAHYETENLALLLVENDFSVPRFELPINPRLTYGSLLCLADYLCKTLNQLSPTTPSRISRSRQMSLTDLNDEMKVKSLGKIFEHCTATYEERIGFMVYIQKSDDMPNEKFSSFLHYDMSEFSGSTSAVSQLDYHLVKNALEALMSFLAGEIFFAIRNLRGEAVFSYKRELSSEIQFFYEFVRKRTSEQYSAMVATPRSTSSIAQTEPDIIKRYIITKVMDNDTNDIVDNNFVLVISQWLIKFCHLSN
ncbi:nucleoporin Nup188 [Tribolium madens]|uniref:nucleoporin Nup188 n=1 Tax=Tribolium madens TaxID=41895 RepID=UPI001CF73A47|nr:nucleoporin Nup188 [Tribolium madens]